MSDNLPALPDVTTALATIDSVREAADLKHLYELVRKVAKTRKGKEREAFRGAMGALRCFRKIGQLLAQCPREERMRTDLSDCNDCSQLAQMITESGLSERHAYNAMDVARITDKAMDEFEAKCEGQWQRAILTALLRIVPPLEKPPGPSPLLLCCKAEEIHLPAESVGIIITSPPYNLGSQRWPMGGPTALGGNRPRLDGIGYGDDMPEGDYQEWQASVFRRLFELAIPGASFFYNHKVRQVDGRIIHPLEWVASASHDWTLRQEIIWDRGSTHNHCPTLFWPQDERVYWLTKGDPLLSDQPVGMPTVWRFHGPVAGTWHPAPFAEELPRRCLQAINRPDLTVLDPFGGSMTTCAVALDMGHEHVIGVDINQDYINQARDYNGWTTESAT